MSEEINVIFDLSPDVQILLDEQDVNLYQEVQRELPSIRLKNLVDPEAPKGTRDIVTVIAVTSTLVSSITPIILRILNMITPPDRSQTWIIEEVETHNPAGSTIIQRKRVLSSSEQRPHQQTDDRSVKSLKQDSSEARERD